MRIPAEPSGGLDRGGKPTVRELLSSLVSNPVDGTIRLHGDRIVMQRTAVNAELRRELVRLLGAREARVFLIRLGFLTGQSDARFVRANWPNLDVGDAFTAGARLHTFSGAVRVETLHNDFDFRKKRFSAEFLWHNSAEAAEFRRARLSTEPECWTQIGYASGYASAFFDTLILYKELECAAQGHNHCRVVGKPADMWGVSDPDVILFRDRIASASATDPSEPYRKIAARVTESGLSELDRLIVAPVRADLDRLARMALPVLVTGAPGTGRSRAARYLHRASGASGAVLRPVFGAQVDLQLCAEIGRHGKAGRRSTVGETVLIDAAETIPASVQPHLARAIEDGMSAGGPRVVALLGSGVSLGAPSLCPDLWYALAALTVRMPPLAEREGQRADIARAVLPVLAERMGRAAPQLDKTAARAIEQSAWPGNLRQMRNVLAAVLAAHSDGGAILGRQIEARIQMCPSLSPVVGNGMGQALDRLMEDGGFSLPDFERSAYQIAVDRARGNLSAAARLLGLTRAQLAYRLNPKNPPARTGTGAAP